MDVHGVPLSSSVGGPTLKVYDGRGIELIGRGCFLKQKTARDKIKIIIRAKNIVIQVVIG